MDNSMFVGMVEGFGGLLAEASDGLEDVAMVN
jgi:hypothetical protein